jgi:hypothetical protein
VRLLRHGARRSERREDEKRHVRARSLPRGTGNFRQSEYVNRKHTP